jgi:hypothetical protein
VSRNVSKVNHKVLICMPHTLFMDVIYKPIIIRYPSTQAFPDLNNTVSPNIVISIKNLSASFTLLIFKQQWTKIQNSFSTHTTDFSNLQTVFLSFRQADLQTWLQIIFSYIKSCVTKNERMFEISTFMFLKSKFVHICSF